MKRIINMALTFVLCLTLFAGCGETPVEPAPAPVPTPEPPDNIFDFTRENMPRMDGSTSLVPLSQAAASLLLGESREDVEDLVKFNRTSQSYRNLMWGNCDILIASVPSAEVYDELDNGNFNYEMAPIATDALIFVVNEGNPVDNLTTDEIIGIYTGVITNWSEVGGADEPIAAFQRNSGAGSQALMEKLVMKDIPMMAPPTELMAGSMGELMEYVRSYDNSSGAIGYSVYYYANDMLMAEGLKIISVDGVEPTDENIRDGLYPHLSNYYTVIAADEAEDSPARVMFEWLQSAEGQRLVESEGYVPVKGEDDFSMVSTSGGWMVSLHPEALTTVDSPEAKYSRMSLDHIPALIPSDDYGMLYPFVGMVNYDDWIGQKPVYGLFDENGRIVCDPVYAEVSRLAYWEDSMPVYVPMLLLGRSVDDGTALPKMMYNIAALDGSFVSPSFSNYQVFDFGVKCSMGYRDENFVIYDFDGNIIFRGRDIKKDGMKYEDILDGKGGYLLAWLDDGDGSDTYLIDPEGNILCGGWASAEFAGEGRLLVYGEGWQTALVDYAGNELIDATDGYMNLLPGDLIGFVNRSSGKTAVYDMDGNMLFELGGTSTRTAFGYINGLHFYRFDGTYFRLDGEWNAPAPLSACPIIYKQEENSLTLMNVLSGESLALETSPGQSAPLVEQLMVNYVTGPFSELPYIMVWDGSMEHPCELISWDLQNRFAPKNGAPGMGTYYTVIDVITGVEYIAVNDANFNTTLYSPELEPVAAPENWTGAWNGMLVKNDENFCTYTDMNSNVFFRYPLMINGD